MAQYYVPYTMRIISADAALSVLKPLIEDMQARNIQKDLYNLQVVLDALCLEHAELFGMVLLERKPGKNKKREVYRELEDAVHQQFFKEAATQERRVLEIMGLPVESIDFMARRGKVPKIDGHPGSVKYDLSIEHILDGQFGGLETPSNFCIYPKYVNRLVDDFVRTQQKQAKKRYPDKIVKPVSREFYETSAKVPYFPGGFRAVDDSKPEHARRIHELIGVELR